MLRYRSDYSNQVHLVNVSTSKHLWMRRDQSFSFQKKAIHLHLESYRKNPKTLLRRYLLVDHFSSLYYVQYQLAKEAPEVAKFLFKAWSPKESHPLCGLPEIIFMPRQFANEELEQLLRRHRVELRLPLSGFQSGIRPLADWRQVEWGIAAGNYSLQNNEWKFAFRFTPDGSACEGRPPQGLQDLNDLAANLSSQKCASLEHTSKWTRSLPDGRARLIRSEA